MFASFKENMPLWTLKDEKVKNWKYEMWLKSIHSVWQCDRVSMSEILTLSWLTRLSVATASWLVSPPQVIVGITLVWMHLVIKGNCVSFASYFPTLCATISYPMTLTSLIKRSFTDTHQQLFLPICSASLSANINLQLWHQPNSSSGTFIFLCSPGQSLRKLLSIFFLIS
jgi:hypothetical protein